jgi:hypothetical protein
MKPYVAKNTFYERKSREALLVAWEVIQITQMLRKGRQSKLLVCCPFVPRTAPYVWERWV